MDLAQDRDRKPVLVDTVTNLRVTLNLGDSLTG